MASIMINLISEQTIPVLQFIREFNEMDKYVFVTTSEMEEKKKTDSLKKALQFTKNNFYKIIVNPESLKDVEQKLEEFYQNEIQDEDKIFINITTGTKLMAMATYKVFSKYDNVKLFYIPINSKVLKQIYPERKYNDKTLTYKIKLDEYLTVYGIEILNKHTPLYDFNVAKKCLELYLEYNFITDGLRKLRNSDKKTKKKLKKEGISINEIEGLNSLVEKIGLEKQKINYYDIEYLTGGWFEEYIFYKMKEKFKLTDEFIGLNYSISRTYGKNVKNEFDVLLILNNSPIIIECKTSNYDSLTKRNFLQETIYKLASLKKDFGLSAKGMIFTLDENIKETDNERAKINDIWIVNRDEVKNNDF